MTDRSGSPSFRLPSGLPLDPGRDQMGNIRHIARETTIPAVLEQGNFQEIPWQDFSRIMVPPAHARDETIYANIVDTVLMDQVGKVSQYIYTNSSGAIALKSSKSCTPKRVYEEFMKISSRLKPRKSGDETTIVAAVTNYGSTESDYVEGATFKNTLEAGQFRDAIIQCFVPSKGVSTNNRTYATKYWLDRMAKEHMKTDVLDINPEISGSNRTNITSYKDKTNNRLMEKTMEQIVLRAQRSLGGKVVQMELEFVEDINGAIWLSRMSRCLLAREEGVMRRSSPLQDFKDTRIGMAAEFGDTTAREAAKLEDGFVNSRPSSIGRHSDRRVERRWNSEPVPDEGAVQEILRAGSRQGSRGASRGSSRGGSRRSPSRGGGSRPTSSSQSPEKQVDTFKIPGARLEGDLPIAESTRMFGSTQLGGVSRGLLQVRPQLHREPGAAEL
jgi:hypothetical protein